MLLPLLLATATTAWAACPPPVDLTSALTSAEEAYKRRDPDAFLAAEADAEAALPCLDAPVDQDLAARIHRAIALRAFVEDRRDEERLAFAAARWLRPSWTFPEDMVPLGQEERQDYRAVPTDPRATEPVAEPKTARIYLDGQLAKERSSSWPTLAQILEDGELTTAYLWPDDPLPPYTTRKTHRKISGPTLLGAAGGGVAAVGLGMVGWAWVASGRYCDPDGKAYLTDADERDSYCGIDEPGARGLPYQVAQVGWIVAAAGGATAATGAVWAFTDTRAFAVGFRGAW